MVVQWCRKGGCSASRAGLPVIVGLCLESPLLPSLSCIISCAGRVSLQNVLMGAAGFSLEDVSSKFEFVLQPSPGASNKNT